MITYISVVSSLALLAAVAQIYLNLGYMLDFKRIAGLIVSRLMETFDADELDQQGAEKYIRDQYIDMCAAFGLPESAVDKVVGHGWQYIEAKKGVVIYD